MKELADKLKREAEATQSIESSDATNNNTETNQTVENPLPKSPVSINSINELTSDDNQRQNSIGDRTENIDRQQKDLKDINLPDKESKFG